MRFSRIAANGLIERERQERGLITERRRNGVRKCVRQLACVVLKMVPAHPVGKQSITGGCIRLQHKNGKLRRLAGHPSLFGNARIQKAVQAPRWPRKTARIEAGIDPGVVVNNGQECVRTQPRDLPLHLARRFAGEESAQKSSELDEPLLQLIVENRHSEAATDPLTKALIFERSLTSRDFAPSACNTFCGGKLPCKLAAKKQQGRLRLNDKRDIQIPVAEERCHLRLAGRADLVDVAGVVVIAGGLDTEPKFEVIGSQTTIVAEDLQPVNAARTDIMAQDKCVQISYARQTASNLMYTAQSSRDLCRMSRHPLVG